MSQIKSVAVVAALVLAAIGPAQAQTAYDTTLSAPGVYFGSGNINTHWTTTTTNGTELGLEALTRYIGPVTPAVGTSTYTVPLGNTAVAGKSGSLWGFAFSINNGPTGPTLNQIVASMSITDSVGHVTVGPFNPITAILDNDGWNGVKNTAASNGATDWGLQNSEALSFSNGTASPFDPAYNSGIDNSFVITLSAACPTCTNQDLGSVSITVVAGAGSVPEPASMILLGFGLAGLASLRRRR